jgi:hypothetical protein
MTWKNWNIVTGKIKRARQGKIMKEDDIAW